MTCRPRSTPHSAISRATYRRCRLSARPILSAAPILILALTSKTMQPSAIYDAADSVIAQRLSQVDGVADVTVAGSEQPAIRVRVDPARLSAMGCPMEDVRTAISNANAAGPVGTFDGDKRAVTIGINDQLRMRTNTSRSW